MSNLDKFTQIATNQTQFQSWLDKMPSALAGFFAQLPEDVAKKLDFSLESLEVFEKWWLSQYAEISDIQTEDDGIKLDGAARYVGETFRRICGGEWKAFFGKKDTHSPQIGGFKTPRNEAVSFPRPFYLVTASLNRRTGVYLRWVVGNYLNYVKTAEREEAENQPKEKP